MCCVVLCCVALLVLSCACCCLVCCRLPLALLLCCCVALLLSCSLSLSVLVCHSFSLFTKLPITNEPWSVLLFVDVRALSFSLLSLPLLSKRCVRFRCVLPSFSWFVACLVAPVLFTLCGIGTTLVFQIDFSHALMPQPTLTLKPNECRSRVPSDIRNSYSES